MAGRAERTRVSFTGEGLEGAICAAPFEFDEIRPKVQGTRGQAKNSRQKAKRKKQKAKMTDARWVAVAVGTGGPADRLAGGPLLPCARDSRLAVVREEKAGESSFLRSLS